MSKRPTSDFIHLAMPFGNTRYDHVRTAMAHCDSTKSVSQLVDHFSGAGRIDGYDNRIRTVHMDEMEFPLGNILVGRHNYERLAIHAKDKFDKGEGFRLLSIVRVVSDYPESSKGKPRYLCERSQGVFDGNRLFDVRPILVFEKDATPIFDKMIEWGKTTFIVAARPYIKQPYNENDQSVQVFLHVAKPEQFTFVSPDHWDKPSMNKAGQYTMAAHMRA